MIFKLSYHFFHYKFASIRHPSSQKFHGLGSLLEELRYVQLNNQNNIKYNNEQDSKVLHVILFLSHLFHIKQSKTKIRLLLVYPAHRSCKIFLQSMPYTTTCCQWELLMSNTITYRVNGEKDRDFLHLRCIHSPLQRSCRTNVSIMPQLNATHNPSS